MWKKINHLNHLEHRSHRSYLNPLNHLSRPSHQTHRTHRSRLNLQTHRTPPEPPLTGPYTQLEWIRVSAGKIEIHGFSLGFIRCIPLDATVNGIRYLVHESHWQWRKNASSPWAEVDGTNKTGEICSYTPKRSGAFRLVMVMSIDGIRGRYSSWNTINALCMPNSDECSYSYPDNPSQSQVAGRRPGH